MRFRGQVEPRPGSETIEMAVAGSLFFTILGRVRHACALSKRRGVAAVELAFLLPFLGFLSLITIDYGRVFYYSQTIANCARNGALYASDPFSSTQSPYASVQAAALADASNLSPAPIITCTNGSDGSGNPYAAVTATYTFQTITNYPGIPGTVNLTRTVTMRVAPVTGTFP